MTSFYRRWFQFVGMALMAVMLIPALPNRALAVYVCDGSNPAQMSADSDGDGFINVIEDVTFGNWNGDCDDDDFDVDGTPNYLDSDDDGDGIGTSSEAGGGTDTEPFNADTDGDGLCDGGGGASACATGEELDYGTDPLSDADLDSDGLTDADEILVYGTDHNDANGDLDGDGISDAVEILVLFTNHTLQDTDGDGLSDGTETGWGDSDVNDYDVGTDLNPNFEDTDGDGMCDGSSTINGCAGNEGTLGSNPLAVDSDGDNVCDGAGTELACFGGTGLGENTLGTDPNDTDTDDDGLADDVDSDPLDADADDDGLIDGTDDANSCYGVADCDGDGLSDGVEYGVATASAPAAGNSPSGIAFAGSSGYSGDVDTGSTTDLNDDDSDDDGILDGDEDANGNGGVGGTETDPNDVDTDSDGLCDGAGAAAGCLVYNGGYGEADYGTDPLNNDTDGDTLTDGDGEVGALGGAGTDPFDIDTDQDGLNDNVDGDPLDADRDDDGLADGADTAIGCVITYDCDGDSLSDGLESGIATAAAPAGGSSTNGISYNGTDGGYVGDADTGSTTNPNSNDTDGDRATDGREDDDGDGNFDGYPTEGNPNSDDTTAFSGNLSGWWFWGNDVDLSLESPVGVLRTTQTLPGADAPYSVAGLDNVAINGQSYLLYADSSVPWIRCGVANAEGLGATGVDIANADIICTGNTDVNVHMHTPDSGSYPVVTVYVSSDRFPTQVFTLSDGDDDYYYANIGSTLTVTAAVGAGDRCIFEDGTTSKYAAYNLTAWGTHDIHMTCGKAVDINVDVANVQNATQVVDVWTGSDSWWLGWTSVAMDDSSPIATLQMVEGLNYYLGYNLYSAPAPQADNCVFKRDNNPLLSWDGSVMNTWDDTWGVGTAINATLTCDETELYTVVLDLVPGSTDADIYLHTATGLWDTVAIYDVDESDNGTTLMEVPMIPAASYFTTAFGSVCTTRYDGLIAYVTCGYEYEIGGKVMGSAGLAGDTVTLSLTSNNDSTVHYATVPADNVGGEGFNFAPATYVVQGSQWEVLIDAQPATPGSFCSVSNGTGTATGSMAAPWLVTNTTVTCGLLRTVTVEVTAQTGFDVDVALASSLGATQTQNNLMNGGSTSFSVVDGSVIDVTVQDYSNHSAYCTVVGGTAVTVSGDLTVFINCGSTYTILGGAISNLTGSGLELRETNTGATAVPVGASYAFPQNILQTGAAYNIVIARQPTAPDQVCSLSGTTNGTVANQDVQGPDVVCNPVSPWYNLAVNVTGLAGDRVRLLEVAGSQVTNVTADGLMTFARSVTNGTYTVQVDQQPQGPQQQCRFNNTGTTSETVVISNANATLNLTCFTVPQYTISVNVSGLAGDRVRLIEVASGQVTNVVADGAVTFPTALTNGTYTVQVDAQPVGPTQVCTFGGSGTASQTLVIAGADASVNLTCVSTAFNVAALVTGKNTGASDLVLDYNAVTYAVASDALVNFGTLISGMPYRVTVATQPALPAQTCEVAKGVGVVAASAISDITVTCVDNLYPVSVDVSGLALGSNLLLDNNGEPLVVAGDGVWEFGDMLTGTALYDVTIIDDDVGQTCVIGSAFSTGNLADDATTVTITCTQDPLYTVSVSVAGLAGDRIRLLETSTGVVTNVTTNGVAEFATDLTNGAYSAKIDMQPVGPAQVCTFDNTGNTAETFVINNANVVLGITCSTINYNVAARVLGKNVDSTDLVLNYNGVTYAVSADGQLDFGSEIDGTPYDVTVQSLPALPAQSCVVGNGLGVVAAAPVSDITVDCSDDMFVVSVDVSGLATGSSLLLSNNGDPMIVEGDGVWPFATSLTGVGVYDVQILDDTSFQTCQITSAFAAGTLADDATTVTILCSEDTLYSLNVNVAGLAGDRVRLVETSMGAVTNVVANGVVSFGDDLTNGTYTVQVDQQPNEVHQVCEFNATNSTSQTVVINNASQTINLTCTTITYTVSGTLRGLLGGNSITLTNNGGDALVRNANGVFTFATPLAEGALYNVRVSVLPTNQVCTVYGRSGVIGQSAANSVEVVCSPLDYDLDGLTDHDELEVWGTATDSTDTDGDLLSDYAEVITHQTNPTHVDTDGDGAQDNWELNGYGAAVTTDPRRVDSDLDGVSDGDEIAYGGNVSVYTAGVDLNPTDPDTDNGGIWDGAEIVDTLDTPTNPLVASDDRLDSDGDGISDYAEINGTLGYVTNHLEADDDNDGLTDSEEILGYGTWATDSDSDDDNLGDAIEVETYSTDPLDVDTDGDTLWDNAEVLALATNPLTSDTDHDGAADNFELSGYGGGVTTDPRRWDSDLDGLSDGFEVGYDGDASVYTAGADLNPTDVDTDDGGIWDGAELVDTIDPQTDPLDASDDRLDTDNDGVSDYDEINGTFSVGGYATNHRDADSDHDGLSDGVELLGYASFATDADSDNDGLDDAVEVYTYHTDLLDADSDDDTLSDGDEVLLYHTQPNDADTDNDGLRDDTEVLLLSTNPGKQDSDADDVTDYAEVNVDANSLNYTAGTDTNPNKADTDNDGLGDGFERDQGTNPNSVDSDGDGLTDRREITNTDTDPLVVDTDGDTLGDGAEEITHHTDPLSTDTDLDGVRDDAELTIGTSPVRADTDGDGVTDGFELSWAGGAKNGNPDVKNSNDMNPLKVDTDNGGVWDGAEVLSSYLSTDPLDRDDDRFDEDHDGITDWDEVNGVLADPTDPYDPDTDDDGLNDGVEVFSYQTDPTSRDTDEDRLTDGEEVLDFGTDPNVVDTDGDTLGDGQEVLDEGTDPRRTDSDRDGLRDDEELVEGEDGYITDPLRADGDNDGLIDGDELARGTNPLHWDSDGDDVKDGDEVYIYETDPAMFDTDGDGISDGRELMELRTNPLDADSDDDGDSDGKEVKELRTDPLDNDKDAIASGGAGGCSVADRATANNWNLLPILLVAFLVGLRRRKLLRPAVAGLLAAAFVATPSQARQLSFPSHNIQSFYMADDVGEYFVTRDSRTRKQLGFQAALGFNYSKEALVVREFDKVKRVVIDRLLTEDTMLSFGILDQLQLDVAVPYHVYVERGNVQNLETFKSNYWGDIRAGLKGRILDRTEYPVGLAVRGFVYAPTGREDRFLGAKSVEYGLQAILDHDFEFIKLAGNLGWIGRESQKAPGSDIDDQLTWSVAADLALAEHFGLIVDVFGATLLKDFFGAEYGTPIEGAVGGRYWLDNGFTMSAGIGRGINSGMGTVPVRMNWEIAYQLDNDRDRDMDGFSDELDSCAGRAEDIDGYRDTDGCPDNDHDEDGVLDSADACPTVAEDRDGNEDRDGCPEFDNDGDGILDEVDACPNAKETINGFADTDGCPDADRISTEATIIDDESGVKLSGEVLVEPKIGKQLFDNGKWTYDLPGAGVYSFTFKVNGYETVYRKFQVTGGQTLKMEIRMLQAEGGSVPAPKAEPAASEAN